MAKTWSFNTTVRNPDRMQNFLRTLSQMEGVEFDYAGQAKFFSLVIQKRLYIPLRSTLDEPDLIDEVYNENAAEDIPDDIVARIVAKYDGSVDAAGRGRTAAGVLNRFGVSVALAAKGPVVITPLGKKWLSGEIDDEELFTKFLLKWQYPNPIEDGYSDFDIKPFLATLVFINQLNQKWQALGHEPVGISKEEYKLFIPSLKTRAMINDEVDELIAYRQKLKTLSGQARAQFEKDYASQRVQKIYGSATDITTHLRDLRDYMDSSTRYFRMTGLLINRGAALLDSSGAGRYIDLAADKSIQIDKLLNDFPHDVQDFADDTAYLEYLNDISQPELPWENAATLTAISQQLKKQVKDEGQDLPASGEIQGSLAQIEGQPQKQQVTQLEDLINEIRITKLRELRHDTTKLAECITRLQTLRDRNYEAVTTKPSLDFEWFTSLALMVLNDAIKIEPNYKIGDDGIPTGFRSNIADIECYYQNFGLSVEVTTLTGRDQFYAEGQPVSRHHRSFENKIPDQATYCLFVAPQIHRDSLGYFWFTLKSGYEGKPQNIIPLTTAQFVEVLKIAGTKIEAGHFNQDELHRLLESMVSAAASYSDSNEWVEKLPELIQAWA